jgi:DNA-binding transcriptional MerR regulator
MGAGRLEMAELTRAGEKPLDSPLGGDPTLEHGKGRVGKGMFSIGEFSRATGLTVKTIRLYHEKGLLKPAWVDDETGYRYFDRADLERARVVRHLRDLDFPLAEIRELFLNEYDEGEVLPLLERQRTRIRERQHELARIATSLDEVIQREREAFAMVEEHGFEIEEKDLAPLKVAGLRWQGRYDETGPALGKVCRRYGRYARGKPLNLYYDAEFKEEGADVESCVPVDDPKEAEGFTVHTLPGGRCVSLIHKGPYQEIGRSYGRLFSYVQEKGWTAALPYREIYLKGPGMLFRGNPKNYLTELQVLVEERSDER